MGRVSSGPLHGLLNPPMCCERGAGYPGGAQPRSGDLKCQKCAKNAIKPRPAGPSAPGGEQLPGDR